MKVINETGWYAGMKNEEDILDPEKKEESGATPDDDVIELVNVIKAEDVSEVIRGDSGGLSLEEEISESISVLEGPDDLKEAPGPVTAADEAPEKAGEAVSDFASDAADDLMVEEMDGEEPILFDEAPPADDTRLLETEAEEKIELGDLDEELQFAFSKEDRIDEDVETVEIMKGEDDETLLYDEDGKVIGEMLAGDEPDDFERELDTMLESLDLADDSGDLELLESDLNAVPQAGAIDEPALDSPGAAGQDARHQASVDTAPLLGAVPSADALSGRSGGTGEVFGQVAAAGISEERLDAIIERVAEKVAERVARETIPKVAERVITQAISALKESLGG